MVAGDQHCAYEIRAATCDGEAFDASDVKFSFERAKAEGSTNKAKKAVFDNISRIETPDPYTVILVLERADGNFLFRMGEATAAILDPKSAAGTATKPIGTGPFRFEDWKKGASITLAKNPDYRNAAAVKMKKVTWRFISDPAAQVSALLAGDIDGMPRFGAPQNLAQFQADKRFTVAIGGTEGKTIVAINNKRKPFDDVRVRRAIAAAVDRKAIVDGALEGYGAPIGSHLVPSDAGYVDLTATSPHDIEKARRLLKDAGVATPLNVTLTLPPPQYARKGGEIVAAQLAKAGIVAKIENVEWAQWLSGAFKGNFDLTIINHVEPLDYATAYADPNYYFGYDSAKFRGLVATLAATQDQKEKARLWRDIQRQLATDAERLPALIVMVMTGHNDVNAVLNHQVPHRIHGSCITFRADVENRMMEVGDSTNSRMIGCQIIRQPCIFRRTRSKVIAVEYVGV